MANYESSTKGTASTETARMPKTIVTKNQNMHENKVNRITQQAKALHNRAKTPKNSTNAQGKEIVNISMNPDYGLKGIRIQVGNERRNVTAKQKTRTNLTMLVEAKDRIITP